MEHQHAPSTITPDRPVRVHPAVWLIAAGIVAALVAIFVFKVEIGTVFTYGVIGLMALSHLFMHGGHGGHGGAPAKKDGVVSDRQSKDGQAGHSGSCH